MPDRNLSKTEFTHASAQADIPLSCFLFSNFSGKFTSCSGPLGSTPPIGIGVQWTHVLFAFLHSLHQTGIQFKFILGRTV